MRVSTPPLASVSYLALFGNERESGTPLVIGSLLLLGVAYPFLTRTRDLRTSRPTVYVALLVAVVVFLSFVYDGAGVLLFVAFPQVWMFTASQRQGWPPPRSSAWAWPLGRSAAGG